MTTVLFYEPDHNGHHFAYLARMLPGFFDSSFELVLATTSEALASRQYERFLKPLEGHFRVIEARPKGRVAQWRIAVRRVADIRRLQKRHDVAHTFVAYADGVWQIFALQALLGRGWPKRCGTLEGVLYRGGFSYPSANGRSSRLKRWLFRRLCVKGIFDRLMLDDEYFFDFAKSFATDSKTRCELAVNPVTFFETDRAGARSRLGLDRDAKLISLSGMIDERKGADRLIDAFVAASGTALHDATLLLAGPQSQVVKDALLRPAVSEQVAARRIVSIDRLLDERDMFCVAAASDLVTAPYPNHSGRSSIVLWAAAAGRPVLGVDRGCIARVIEQERLGWTCDVSRVESLREGLVSALRSPWDLADQERAIRYARWHSVDNYRTMNARFVRDKYASATA